MECLAGKMSLAAFAQCFGEGISLNFWRRKPRLRDDPADQRSQELVRECAWEPRFLMTGTFVLFVFYLQLPPVMGCLALSPLAMVVYML